MTAKRHSRGLTYLALGGLIGAMALVPACNKASTPTDKVTEKTTVQLTHEPTPSDTRTMQAAGWRAMRHIANAREALKEGKLDQAKENLAQAGTLLDIIKIIRPKAVIKDRISVASRHLTYKDKEKVAQELIPITSQVDLLEDFTGKPAVKGHLEQAKTQIKNGDTKGAAEHLDAADVGLVLGEVDLPFTATARHVKAAQGALAKKDTAKALKELDAASDGLEIQVLAMDVPVRQQDKALAKAPKKEQK